MAETKTKYLGPEGVKTLWSETIKLSNTKVNASNVVNKGTTVVPVYFDGNGVAVPITSYSGTSKYAEMDADGNTISSTYATTTRVATIEQTYAKSSDVETCKEEDILGLFKQEQ